MKITILLPKTQLHFYLLNRTTWDSLKSYWFYFLFHFYFQYASPFKCWLNKYQLRHFLHIHTFSFFCMVKQFLWCFENIIDWKAKVAIYMNIKFMLIENHSFLWLLNEIINFGLNRKSVLNEIASSWKSDTFFAQS